MKKKTVITTEKLEVWILPQPFAVPAEDARAQEADNCNSESKGDSLTLLPEEPSEKTLPPSQND